MDKEVEHGWELPFTNEPIRHIKDSGVLQLGVAKQFSINKKGERYNKICVAYDCSFPGPSGLSINNWVMRDTLQPCFYGL